MANEQENASVTQFRGKVSAAMPTATEDQRAAKRAFIAAQGNSGASNQMLRDDAYAQQNKNAVSDVVLSHSDLPKVKDGMVPGYQGADGRTSCQVAETASSWSVGADADPSIIINESKELADAAGVQWECSYANSMYAGNSNVKNQLKSPANKRGPKTGANGPFDSANMTGAELNQSYLDDPPIGAGSMGQQVAGTPAPGRLL